MIEALVGFAIGVILATACATIAGYAIKASTEKANKRYAEGVEAGGKAAEEAYRTKAKQDFPCALRDTSGKNVGWVTAEYAWLVNAVASGTGMIDELVAWRKTHIG